MMELGPIGTALLLGIFVLFAGCYGLLYAIARLKERSTWMNAAYACYALQVVVTLLIVALTPLTLGWQLLVIVSCLAYFKLPAIAWSHLELTHSKAEVP
ncbi:MAG: hypothetical protein ABIP67_08530 [Burkholderiales bacterium]